MGCNMSLPEKVHFFLTGEVGSGKSTVLNKTLAMLAVSYGGFKTYFGDDRASPDKKLYINQAALPPRFSEQHIAAHFREGKPPAPVLDAFNILGAGYIKNARENSCIIVMDECGTIEKDADMFKKEVLNALDDDKPVLGVLKLRASGWAEKIRNHPKVNIITVDEVNRDSLPQLLYKTLATIIGSKL
ncbi:MAG: nucleotide kinase [Clostridiales bacterium]|jgi:nucleoside-triphosphatase|nr:nucleotide kinase [Clostridiales bacterium]